MMARSNQIHLFVGPQDLLAEIDSDLRVTSSDEYVSAYDKIANALHEEQGLKVSIIDLAVAGWFEKMVAKYGEARIRVHKVTYVDQLADLWKVEIPEWVEESDVREANLLAFDIHAIPGQDFETLVLSAFFSPFLTSPQFIPQRLEEIVRSFNAEQWLNSRSKPVLRTVLKERLNRWRKSSQNEGESILIDWLEESPAILIENAAQLRILCGYPEDIGTKVFGNKFKALAHLAPYFIAIPSNESVAQPFLGLLRVHIETCLRKLSPSTLDELLDTVSGCLEVEFEYVRKVLRSGIIDVNERHLQMVRSKFGPLKDRPQVNQDLTDLDLLVKKAVPSEPHMEWSEDEWIQWAIDDYFPYRFWMEETGRYSDEMELFVDRYSEWLFSNYPNLRLNSRRMVYYKLAESRAEMQSADVVLVVVIDNFNIKFYSDFESTMNQEGFFTEKLDYCFSLLPSCTEVSKKSLLIGEAQPFSGGDYGRVVEDAWNKATGRRIRYLPNIGALRRVQERDSDLYFLNYLPVDRALHLDENDFGVSHSQLVRNYLRSLAKDIHAFALRIGAERDLKVIVVSDHGSTRIPIEAPNPLDQDFFKNLADEKHHRYIKIDDSKLEMIPEGSRFQCFLFPKDDFGLEANYLVAKKLFRFIRTSSSTYFHGGLSPEETITPFAVFSPVSVSPKAIRVDLIETEFYVMRKVEIQLQLTNTNEYSVDEIKIEVYGSRVDGQPVVEIATIEPFSKEDLNLVSRFNATKSGPQKIFVRVSYSFMGQPQISQEHEFDIHLKTIVEAKPSIFDMEGDS